MNQNTVVCLVLTGRMDAKALEAELPEEKGEVAGWTTDGKVSGGQREPHQMDDHCSLALVGDRRSRERRQ